MHVAIQYGFSFSRVTPGQRPGRKGKAASLAGNESPRLWNILQGYAPGPPGPLGSITGTRLINSWHIAPPWPLLSLLYLAREPRYQISHGSEFQRTMPSLASLFTFAENDRLDSKSICLCRPVGHWIYRGNRHTRICWLWFMLIPLLPFSWGLFSWAF